MCNIKFGRVKRKGKGEEQVWWENEVSCELRKLDFNPKTHISGDDCLEFVN